MKLNICILCMATIYNSFCLAAAEPIEPPARIVRSRSPVFQPPESADIVFPFEQARIVICTEKLEWANRIKGYLENDPWLTNLIEQALHVAIVGPIIHIENVIDINNSEQLAPLTLKNCIVIAFGDATRDVFVAELPCLSIIFFDPVIPERYNTHEHQSLPLTPYYKYISNRVYNFYSWHSLEHKWRKIYPANNGSLPAQLNNQYYFKGINILTQVIDRDGYINRDFNFETMDESSFHMILKTIAKTNKYRLQPNLRTIIRNYSTQEIQRQALYPLRKININLPVVTINKPLVLKENPPTLQSEVAFIATKGITKAIFGNFDVYYNYKCQITPELAEQLKPIIENEKALSSYTRQMYTAKGVNVEKELKEYKLVQDNPYMPGKMRNKNESVDTVSTEIKVYRLEHDYIEKRKHDIILPVLQHLCQGAAESINIAIVASGGGSRAMFATYGALKGLNDIGALDATSYICGLSGSTWAISSIFTQANTTNNGAGMSATEAIAAASRISAENAHNFNFLKEAICRAPTHPVSDYPTTLYVKSLLNQPITNTDWYGNSIAEKLLGAGAHVREKNYAPNYLSQQLGTRAQWIVKDFELPQDYVPKLPFPIYTAVTPLYNTPARIFPWFEFTPYQIGAVIGVGHLKTGMFVKTWAFGRVFEAGHSRDFAPEQALDFYLGVFGSAMNCTLSEALAMAPEKAEPLIKGGKYLASWIPGTGNINMEYRPRFAEVFNPMYGMTDEKFEGKFADFSANKTIGLIDAGFAFNLPFPPLNDYKGKRPERKPDIIIFIDASADAKNVNEVDTGQNIKQAWPNGNTLRLVERYARENEVPFPKLPNGNLASRTCSVFEPQHEQQEHSPTVIYLPVAKNKNEINTFATFNGINIMQKVRHDNTVHQLEPTALATINLGDYGTQHTNLSIQEAINLMALMQYNVLRNSDQIKQAICRRARGRAPQPAPAGPVAPAQR